MSEERKKEIKTLRVKAKELKTGFGNPRKITKKKKDELKQSLEQFGDFGLFLIDEKMNIIAGNQRLSVIMEMNPEQELLCKQLIGYTRSELKAINIKDNTHSGEWDLDMLADWTADLQIDLGLDLKTEEEDERKIGDMEPVRFERYNYVVIACDNEIDYNELTRNLGIEGKKIAVAKRKMKARAIWYHDIKSQIVPKEES